MQCFDFFFFFKQQTAYEMRISDWSSDVCSSDLLAGILNALGSKVSMFIRHDQALRTFDAIIRDNLMQEMTNAGITFNKGVEIASEIGSASCRERVCQYV